MKKIYHLIIIGLLLYNATLGNAEVIVLNQETKVYALKTGIELFEDRKKTVKFTDPEISSLEYVPLSNWEDPFLPQTTYYGKINIINTIPNSENHTEWILKFPLIFTDIEVLIVEEENQFFQRTGFFVPTNQRDFVPTLKANLVKLKIPHSKKVRVYFKAQNQRLKSLPNFDLQLIQSDEFYASLKNKKQGNALFIGFVVMMLIYNLFLFSFARDLAYIYYSIYLLVIATFSAYNTGDLADWFDMVYTASAPHFISLFKLITYFALIAYGAFLRSFLDLSKLLPKWDLIFKAWAYIAIPFLILDTILMVNTHFNYNIADIITITYILGFLATSFIFLIPLYKTKDKKGYFIIVGVTLMSLGIFLTILDRFQTVDYSTLYFKIGTVLEIIVFSLGLAFRRREIEFEKRDAEFELEKSKILQEQEHREAERLKELDNLKSILYTNITHEFRTPLTVIMGIADNLKNNSQAKELIKRNSQNLLRLINQMLDFSKLESGNLQLNLHKADIISFLQYLTESFYSLASEKKIRLTFYSEIDQLEMYFDEEKIQYIIYNLLSNALNYTKEFGKVILHTRAIQNSSESFLQIKVKDTGMGISEKDLPYIFDRFFQSRDSKKELGQGTGIGLSFTKDLVHLMKGTITVNSQPNVGSEFTIRLPVPENVNEGKIQQEISSSSEIEVENAGSAVQLQNSIKKLDGSNASKPIILLIEDNLDVVTYIKSCLEDSYEVQTALNGQLGIEKAIEIIPDIIISDVMMPEKNGLEVCELLKSDDRTNHIPIILLTAKATQENKIAGLKTGADAYLTKPFDKKELYIRIEKLVQIRKQIQEKYSKDASKLLLRTKSEIEDSFIQKVVLLIEENLEDPDFSIAHICHELHLSHTQVYRKIKAITGETPVHLIRIIRLQRGLELLKNSEKNISEIAFEVGFKDPNYFSRAFNQEYGKSPSSIRK